ncbi:MAG: carboxymuconolactone decarboxylase family protein [Gammaproteobacteria bacterium]|nr:carboxymuconolactone decarboxylase family protein [Gammaproteobacteria bacterium]
MAEFIYHDTDSAPGDSLETMESAQQAYGMLPNLYRKMAESPALAKGYWELGTIFASSSLSAVEQQVVLLATSTQNGCTYCVGAHSAIADMMKIPAEVTDALRDGKPVPDTKLEALRKFTQQVVSQRGWVAEADTQSFLDAGFTRAQVLDVVLGVGLKTLSNYANHIMQTGLDDAFASRTWQSPAE